MNRLSAMGDRMERWAWWLDRRPALILAALAVVYLALVQTQIRRILWHDELFTYYIAQAPTLSRFLEEVRLLDLNPPMIYALVRLSHNLFGTSALATRLPSVVAFFLASIGAFVFLSRRVGAVWAAAGVALCWYSPLFFFAIEARPYALLLAFFSLTLVSWDSVTSAPDPLAPTQAKSLPAPVSFRSWALAGIAAGNTGMMLSHVFAPLSILPFCIAELVRSWRLRRIDWAIWLTLLLPLAAAVVYIPLIQNGQAVIFPVPFQGSFRKMLMFYPKFIVLVLLPGLLTALALALAVAAWRRDASSPVHTSTARDAPLLLASLLPPALLNVMAMRSHGPFYDRYGNTTVLMIYVMVILFIAYETRINRLAGLAVAVALLGFSLAQDMSGDRPRAFIGASLDRIRPELPLVTNSALTFMEMDHYESAGFLARVYDLVDRESAIKYAHSTLCEGYPLLKQYFPIRANFSSYKEFVTKHRRFLVYGMIDHEGDWLLRKLIAEGARVTPIGRFDTPYLDSDLFEVTFSDP